MSTPLSQVRAFAAQYPGTYEEAPWGSIVVKVRKKIFVFLSLAKGDTFSMSVKLPISAMDALQNEWATPMGYGMGKHGWVHCVFDIDEEPPMALLFDWIDESFRIVAPKAVVKGLPEAGPPPYVAPEPREPAEPSDLTVLLVGDDPLRLQRASTALSEAGVSAHSVPLGEEALDAAGQGAPDVLVLDCCRNAREALKLAGELTALTHGSRMWVVGLRNLKAVRSVEDEFPGVETSREAPGDAKLVAAILGKG